MKTTSDARRGGEFQGESHQGVNNGMRAVIVDNGNEPILVEGSEAIINKKAMNSPKKYTITGTTKQIVSALNQKEGNGRAIGDSEAEILKIFNEGGTVSSQKDVIYKEWKKLVNMSASELTFFYKSAEGKVAGLSNEESGKLGISNGRQSSRWIVKMKRTPYSKWTNEMFVWAKKQISFIKRMSGNRGEMHDEDGEKTRKHTSLLIWGHNPEKNKVEFEKDNEDIRFEEGGLIGSELFIVKYRITLTEGGFDTFFGGLNDDKDDAYSDYNRINNSDFDDSNAKTNQKMLEKLTYKYNFIGELDSEYDETIEDFKEDYENDDLWELVDEPEVEYLESEDVVAVNDDTDSIIDEIQEFINEKYIHKQYGSKYMVLDVENEDEDSIGSFTIRVADHSGNPQNKKGKTLSFVIANENDF